MEAYNKIVKNEFLAVEDIPNIDDGKLRYDIFVRSTMKLENTEGLMVLLHQKCFYKELITSTGHINNKAAKNITHVCN